MDMGQTPIAYFYCDPKLDISVFNITGPVQILSFNKN